MKKTTTYYLPPTIYSSKKGFSLMELLIFSAIFAVVMVSFITILVTVLRVQSRQSGAAEVNQQSLFLLQQVQYYVERSSLVDMPQDTSTSTLKLRLGIDAQDPIYIYASGTIVYLKQTDGGTPQALTTSKVNVSSLSFTRRSNGPSHDSVGVSFLVSYNTSNLTQQFSQALQTAIARVSAANFDSNLVPTSTATYSLGTASNAWTDINGVIKFSGSNVGIGTASTPQRRLQVSGPSGTGDIYIDTAGNSLIIHDPSAAYCWWYRPTTATGAWNISSSTCP